MTWRLDSRLTGNDTVHVPVLPIIHPAAILRQWSQFNITRYDLHTRVPKAKDWRSRNPPRFLAPGDLTSTLDYLKTLLLRADHRLASGQAAIRLSVDIETIRRSFISCIGLCHTLDSAISIPFVHPGTYDPYFNVEEETLIVSLLRRILTHPGIALIGQNFIYDIQHLEREFLLPRIRHSFDTMLAQHVLLPGTPKSLGHLSSIYCKYHWYWKDDSEEWDEKKDLGSLLRYNCEDVLRTLEISEAQRQVLSSSHLDAQWSYMMESVDLALSMMERGTRIDIKRRASLRTKLMLTVMDIDAWFATYFPQSLVNPDRGDLRPWHRSPTQLREVLMSLGLKVPLDRKSGQRSTGKEAMKAIRRDYPGLDPILSRIEALRAIEDSIEMLSMSLDYDRRIRCSFNPGGAATFRWSSSKDAFGRGGNLQNLPKLAKTFGENDAEDTEDEEDMEDTLEAAE